MESNYRPECTLCKGRLKYGADHTFIWASQENTFVFCGGCGMRSSLIHCDVKCIVCDNIVKDCVFTVDNALDLQSLDKVCEFSHTSCVNCYERYHRDFVTAVHKPCCSLSCRDHVRDEDLRNLNLVVVNRCNHCSSYSRTMPRCGRCKKVYYCNVNCQREDWRSHKMTCFDR